MVKPVIIKRQTKGAALTYAEQDANFQNLDDATITLVAGTAGVSVVSDLNGSITLVAGSGISLAGNNTSKEITITASEAQNLFQTVVAGSTSLVADAVTDTLTLSGGTGITVTGNASTDTATFTLANTAVTPASYTYAAITVDAQGRITAASSGTAPVTSVTGTSGRITSTGGTTPVIDLATSGVTAGSYTVSSITVDSYGRITSASSGSAGGLNNIVEDTTPQLGGVLDTQGYSLTQNGSIGTGSYITLGNNITMNANTGYVVQSVAPKFIIGSASATAEFSSNGAYNLLLTTNTSGGTTSYIQLTAGANGDIAIIPTGTGTVNIGDKIMRSVVFKDYAETIYTSGSTTGTITPDVVNGNVQQITLTGSITFSAFANAQTGHSMTLIIKQPASGGPYTLTSTMKFAGGAKTLSTSANATDILSVFYDGTTYWASLGTNFS